MDGIGLDDLLASCFEEGANSIAFQFEDPVWSPQFGNEPPKCVVARRVRNESIEVVHRETSGRIESLILEHVRRPTESSTDLFSYRGRKIPVRALAISGGWLCLLQCDLQEPSDADALVHAKQMLVERWRPRMGDASAEANARFGLALKAARNLAALSTLDVEALLREGDQPSS